MGRMNDFNRLADRMDALAYDGESPFHAWGASRLTEIAALRALVYAKMDKPPVPKIAREIGSIMARKYKHGYGSTQSTVLALKAIAAYAKFRVQDLADPIAFALDGNKIFADGKDSVLLPDKHTVSIRYPEQGMGKPYLVEADWRVQLPPSQEGAPIEMLMQLGQDTVSVGGMVRMKIEVRNTEAKEQAMTIAKIAIPGGLQLQPWQLKEWTERREVAYYEIFNGYLVLYWRDFKPGNVRYCTSTSKRSLPESTVHRRAAPGYIILRNKDTGMPAPKSSAARQVKRTAAATLSGRGRSFSRRFLFVRLKIPFNIALEIRNSTRNETVTPNDE